MVKIGFDVDGVLALHTLHLNRKAGKDNVNSYKVYKTCVPQHLEQNYINDNNTIYLVTGRKERYRKLTLNWLKKNKFTYDKIYFFDGKKKSFDNLAQHKINVINRKGIEFFFEDTPEIACKIKKECPSCKVYLLFEGKLMNISVVA